MPFKQRKKEPFDARCNVRLRAGELIELREAAEQSGLSLSEYMRRRALGIVVIARADMAVVRELRRLGGLLKRVHVDSQGAYSTMTAQALGEISRYMGALSRDR